MNTGWKEYLSFSRKETLGIIILLAIILILVLMPVFFNKHEDELAAGDFEKFRKELAGLQKTGDDQIKTDSLSNPMTGIGRERYSSSDRHSSAKTELFEFDPNTLSAEGWKD